MSSIDIRSNQKVKIITKIYTWALILEPLLFFVFSGGESSGINLSISRLLQSIVLIYLLIIYILSKHSFNLYIVNYKKYIFKYFLIILIGTLISLLFYNNYSSNIKFNIDNIFMTFFRGQYFRPIIEFIIILYYFLVYLIFPKYIFKNKLDLQFFFLTFKKILSFILIAGFLDFFYSMIKPGAFLIGRHLSDNMYVGIRFHSFCGEPRDAFVFLIFSLVILTLDSIFNKTKIKKIYIYSIIIALILTQSASGILGLFFSIILLIFFSNNFNRKLFLYTIIFIIFISITSIVIINNTERLKMYFDVYKEIYEILKSNEELPYLLYVQSVNIFPLWKLFINTINYNWIPVLVGSGIGSSSFLNNSYVQTNDLANTNSQLVRLLYEVGLIGTFYFIKIFTSVYNLFIKIRKINNKLFYFLFFLLLGANLSHRSTTIYITSGILVIMLTQFHNEKKRT